MSDKDFVLSPGPDQDEVLEKQDDALSIISSDAASPAETLPHSPKARSMSTTSSRGSRPRILPMGSIDRSSSPISNIGAKRMSLGWFVQQPMSANSSGNNSPTKPNDKSTRIHSDFILRRIQQNTNEKTKAQNAELSRTFSGSRGHHRQVSDSDWDFWTQVVQDYQEVAKTQPERLKNAIFSGFPVGLRPILWQVISNSRNPDLEDVYSTLCQETEVLHSKAIEKDLARTSLVVNVDDKALSRILRAYSVFDPDVGYTQGMAFVAVPLLFDIPESDVFCLFVQLMKGYDFRSLYLPEMPGLHLKLYQFDRLLEDRLEKIHIHLKRQGVVGSMYASQWFLTVFAYKFPVELVERIFDIVIAEGFDAILRIAFALMKQNADHILTLKFDDLLPFLKDNIFDAYANRPGDLVRDTAQIDITPQILAGYELEHQEIQRNERERAEQMDTLRTSNSRLTVQVRTLEVEFSNLNTEHIEIANKMVASGLEIARLTHENEELRIENRHLKASVEEDFVAVVKERDNLREVRKRLEDQIEGLQTALASAMS